MTAPSASRFGFRHAVSGQVLFYVAMAMSLVLTAAFSVSVLLSAKRADLQMNQNVQAQLLRILEENGVSGLAAALDTSRNFVLPDANKLELALWQVRGETRRLLLETTPGVANAFLISGSRAEVGGTSYDLRSVDVAAASQGWALPMLDVELTFGFEQPTQEMSRAYRLVATIIALSLSVCAFMSFLQALHWQQYRRSLSRINALLDRYSNGETGIRFQDETPSPELRELGRHLNVVLPRIDVLFADLRALSAHLAHELRTPLQTIRSGLRKVVREEDKTQRIELAQSIDRSIDGADARLQTVMQLFRLQADADVEMAPDVALGGILQDLVYDFEEDLQKSDRTLDIQIDTSICVVGNVHLLELMISNLLSNAGKYALPHSVISISLSAQNGKFRLEVSNAGSFSEDLATQAFDRYAQGPDHRGITGFGLGLALVSAIAQRHDYATEFYQEADPDNQPRVHTVVTGDTEGKRNG